jgi:hypothetical protein
VSDSQHAAIPPEGPHAAADPVTESTDPVELRAQLAQARERLSFYKGFDRLIGENIRRSGELMLETLSIREQVAAGGSRAERERLAIELDDVARRLDEVTSLVQALASRVSHLQQDLRAGSIVTSPVSVDEVPPKGVTPVQEESPAGAWDAPRGIDVIAHHVPRAAVAVALQEFLGSLEPVLAVEAREFAEGILRLHVTASRPLRDDDFAGWNGAGPLSILQCGANAIEVSLG